MADGFDIAKNGSGAGYAAAGRLFAGGTVLCDGAMGTMLYSRGVFINRCYDELNLSQPELIREIHAEYLQAGAEVIETNTFGANSFRLETHGLKDKVREINLAGCGWRAIAPIEIRDKQAAEAFVAGAMGPLGVRLEPLGKVAWMRLALPSPNRFVRSPKVARCWGGPARHRDHDLGGRGRTGNPCCPRHRSRCSGRRHDDRR